MLVVCFHQKIPTGLNFTTFVPGLLSTKSSCCKLLSTYATRPFTFWCTVSILVRPNVTFSLFIFTPLTSIPDSVFWSSHADSLLCVPSRSIHPYNSITFCYDRKLSFSRLFFCRKRQRTVQCLVTLCPSSFARKIICVPCLALLQSYKRTFRRLWPLAAFCKLCAPLQLRMLPRCRRTRYKSLIGVQQTLRSDRLIQSPDTSFCCPSSRVCVVRNLLR